MPHLPAEPQSALRDALSQIQLAYARVAQAGEGEAPAAGAPGGESGAAGEQPGTPGEQRAGTDKATKEDEERARARSKIWTPPGT